MICESTTLNSDLRDTRNFYTFLTHIVDDKHRNVFEWLLHSACFLLYTSLILQIFDFID